MSTFTSATIDAASTVGRAAKYLDPRSPFSSAVTNTNSSERLGRSGDRARDAATSSRTAVPEALSIAPL
jgi:hypothetical protein